MQTEYTYEPFGHTTLTGAANTSSYQYTGRENDDTGLYYYRARYYHPQLQRFISEDPIEFFGGDINLYGYVGNNPLTFVDPLGLDKKPKRPDRGSPPWGPPLGPDTPPPGGPLPPDCPLGAANCFGGSRPQRGGPPPQPIPPQPQPLPTPDVWPGGSCDSPGGCVFQGEKYNYGDDIPPAKPRPYYLN